MMSPRLKPLDNMKEFIVDSCVFVGFIASEKSAPVFAQYLDKAFDNKIRLLATSVNMGEVYFSACRYLEKEIVEEFLFDLKEKYLLEIITPSYEDCLAAARFKTQGGVSYFDCFNLVLASQRPKTEILTLDSEYTIFQKDFKIKFL